MQKTATKKRDFTEGKILKKLILFAVPLALASFMQKLFHATDVAVIGQFGGSVYQASIGATGTISSLLVNFFVGFSVGVNVAMANAHGAKDEARKERVLHTGITLALIAGVIVTVLGLTLSKPLLKAMNTPEDIIDYAGLYLTVCFLGKPATLVYNFGSAILRAVGESKRPLYYLSVAGVLNVVINIVTVVFFKWHVVGVALGTILSMYLAAGWVLIDLIRGKAGVKLSFRKLRIHKKESKKILRIGLPMAINTSLFSVSNLLIQSNVNAFGKNAIAGKSIAGNLEEIIETFANAIMHGVVTFVGQNLGAKKQYRVHRIIGAGVVACAVWYAFSTAVLLAFGRYLCMVFNSDEAVIGWAMRRVLVMEVWMFTTIGSKAYGGALKGMGKTLFPMLTNLFFTCIVRVGYLSFIYPNLPEQTYERIYMIYPITWFLSSFVQIIVYYALGAKLGHFKKPAFTTQVPQTAQTVQIPTAETQSAEVALTAETTVTAETTETTETTVTKVTPAQEKAEV